MSKPQNRLKVKRTVPDGAIMPLAYVRKLPKRSRGPVKFPDMRIRFAFRNYINRHPDLTSATKRVGEYIIRLYNFKLQRAWPSRETIADELSIDVRTVARAITILHDAELIFIKSGGPSRRGSLGPKANEFVPNFWLVLNRETGAIIKNAKYVFSGANPRGCQESVGHSAPIKSVGHSAPSRNHANPRGCQESVGHSAPPCSDNGVSGAPTSPASADAAAGSTPAPQENQLEILPPDSEKVKVIFGQFATVAPRCFDDTQPDGMHVEHLIDTLLGIIDDGGKNDVEFLRPWCEDDSIDKRLPNHGTEYVHIILDGSRTPMTCEMGNAGTSGTWTPDDWVAFEVRS